MDKRHGARHRGGKEAVFLNIYLGSGPEALDLKEQLKMKMPERGHMNRWLRKQVMAFLGEGL